ncbi:PD-(D/E)XK nuclease family protein [Bifidobacterium pongonis]|uniref:PD-(D/E)XK nuclease family protein n=1 Tax=Bifidobacterium pongonis TaxID=2834432 RepID=UPI0030841086
MGNASKAIERLIKGEAAEPLLIVGMPGSGKTGLAYRSLVSALRAHGDNGAIMCVPNRNLGSMLSDNAIRELGALAQARPVTTLSALAFRVIAASRSFLKLPMPKLLNGAEQDSLLRQVLAVHLNHAVGGDLCDTCKLLRLYFAQDDWAGAVIPSLDADGGDAATTTAAMLENGISASFVSQLRDMLARMDELGATPGREQELIGTLRRAEHDDWRDAERLTVQWRLVFALRGEYEQALAAAYPGEYRLDASRLLVEGAAVLGEGGNDADDARFAGVLPRMLLVDDYQDTTLAGLRFIEALHGHGVAVVLDGNPDESVQTFRGSYPEYLFDRAIQGALQARLIDIGSGVDETEDPQPAESAASTASSGTLESATSARKHDYLDLVASRVSLSITSTEPSPLPVQLRPGKMPVRPGAWPIAKTKLTDDSLACAIYRSPREELDDVVWRIKRAHLDHGTEWNDMAVIAHDNATVRRFGERLRRDGVPVRYSSVTRPLKSEPFVRGLFALIELANLRVRGLEQTDMTLEQIGAFSRARVVALMESPLVTVGAKPGEGAPARIEPIESAMSALESLAGLDDIAGDAADTSDASHARIAADTENAKDATNITDASSESDEGGNGSDLARIVRAWKMLVETERRRKESAHAQVDEATVGVAGTPEAFGVLSQYAMLALDEADAPAADVLAVIGSVVGGGRQLNAFQRVFRLIDGVAQGLRALPSKEPQFVLALAWDTVDVAETWQRMALANTPEGRAANDRLDTAMRLFQYAQGGAGGADIVDFIEQVRSMEIEADSLAKVGPVEQAVELTTPAGAAGRHWRHVWIPQMQQDVWPNLAERATLFGGEDLADVVLHGDGHTKHGDSTHDERLEAVLSSEKKSFLVALTRATETAMVSAVLSDDATPSDFMYGYMPEHCPRDIEAMEFTAVGSAGESDEFAGLDADPRGLVAQARVMLARHPEGSPQARDAAATLALLARNGVDIADPDDWPFLEIDAASEGVESTENAECPEKEDRDGEPGSERDNATVTRTVADPKELSRRGIEFDEDAEGAPIVTLSPSAVDNLWACPVCWLMENRFAGPRLGSASTRFGTLIHAVAQRGSEEGLDMPGAVAGTSAQTRTDTVAKRLIDIYDELKPDIADITKAQERYAAMCKDEKAETLLRNLASYFATSNESDYLGKNAGKFSIGTLRSAECETEFSARFTLDDILAAYNALPGMKPIGRATLMQLMGALVGGWPEGMREDMTVRLTGRIDRKETRVLPDGSTTIRLIDYKTGAKRHLGEIFSDLQLVCYQLGLVFPERGRRRKPVHIAQSGLFYVQDDAAPALSFSPEGAFQPPLFVDGVLNPEGFEPRDHYPKLARFIDIPAFPQDRPHALDQVDDEAWQDFLHWNGTQAMWSLVMIARVFYAAAASRSRVLVAHPNSQHKDKCRMKDVCPACAGQIVTVYETRQA